MSEASLGVPRAQDTASRARGQRLAKHPPNSAILRVRRTPDIRPHRGGTHHTRL